MSEAREKYGDIIDREHQVSQKHPRMSRINRAAQFAPFAALTGYDDLIRESSRFTNEQTALDDAKKEQLDSRLRFLLMQQTPPKADFTYFVPDGKKAGGEYVTVTGRVIGYSQSARCITLDSGQVIFTDDIAEIESDVFNRAEW